MQTTAIRTVANSLPENEVIFLTLLISNRYILFAELRIKNEKQSESRQEAHRAAHSHGTPCSIPHREPGAMPDHPARTPVENRPTRSQRDKFRGDTIHCLFDKKS